MTSPKPLDLARMKSPSGSNIGDIGECGSRLYAMQSMSDLLASPEGAALVPFYTEFLGGAWTARGGVIHPILEGYKNIDFARLSAAPYVVPAVYTDAVQGHDSAQYFVFQALVQRDITIADWIRRQNARNPGNPIIGFEAVWQDDIRFHGSLEDVKVSAQPDIAIVAKHANGAKSGLILDYKSGFGYNELKSAYQKTNGHTEQLATLAVLFPQHTAGLISVDAGLITPATLDKPVMTDLSARMGAAPLTHFKPADLARAERTLAGMVRRGQEIAAQIAALPEDKQAEKFEQEAKVGCACNYCPAVGTCPKLAKVAKIEVQQAAATAVSIAAHTRTPGTLTAMLSQIADLTEANRASKSAAAKEENNAKIAELREAIKSFTDAQKTDAVRDLAVVCATADVLQVQSAVKRYAAFQQDFIKFEAGAKKAPVKGTLASVGITNSKEAQVVAPLTVRDLFLTAREIKGEHIAGNAIPLSAEQMIPAVTELHKAGAGFAAVDDRINGMLSHAELEQFRDQLRIAAQLALDTSKAGSPDVAKRGKEALDAFRALAAHFTPKYKAGEYQAHINTNATRFVEFAAGMSRDGAVIEEINAARLHLIKTGFNSTVSDAERFKASESLLEKINEIAGSSAVDAVEFAAQTLVGANKRLAGDSFDIRVYSPSPYIYKHVVQAVAEVAHRDIEDLEMSV